ncbi:hypothetical protein Tco_0247711 [Tanacetum coccineum]
MANLNFADTHNMVAFLSKPAESEGFEQIVDFLNANPIRYALTINPTIYTSCIEQFWATVKVKTVNGEVQLQALVDGKKIIITESTVRRDLQLEDAEGVDCLPNATIFEQLALMRCEQVSQKLTFYKAFFSPQWKFLIHTVLQCLSPKTTAWNEFSSTMASAIICLATNQKFNFSKFIFENQAELGEGSANPTDPHPTPTFIQPSTSQPQKKQKPRKPKRKDTQIPQSSGPTEHVADEAVYKELDDSLVRAATTASSLEAEQDSGNINKTRSKATPNESSSLETTSGGGPRCQETMGDTIAQTRFENVSKLSNDPLLARGNTLRSGKDSLKLKELIELCTNLQTRVLDLEKTETTQAEEIVSLKRRVKKLEHKKRSRTHGFERLYKVGLTARVESSRDEESLGEDASKQGRINAIDTDEDITLVNDQDDDDMFDVNTLAGDEVLAEQEVAAKDVNLTVDEVTLAQVSAATTTTTATILTPRKGIVITKLEEHVKPKKKDLIRLDEEIASKLQVEFDEEERLAREKDKANVALTEEWDDIQAKVDADYLLAQRLKHFAAKRAEEKRNKPPTQAQQRKIMCTYLKNMEGKKPKDLKNKSFDSIQKMFDRAFKRVNTFVDFRTEVMEGSSKRAGTELEQEVTKKQKVDNDQETVEVDDDQETTKIKELMEIVPNKEDVAIDAIPLDVTPPSIVDWKILKEGKKTYY